MCSSDLVIPYPAEVTMQAETCKLKSGQKIHYLDASLYKEAAFLEKKLADLNYKMKVIPGKKAAKGINLSLDNRLQNKEGYQLIIAPKQVLIKGGRKASWSGRQGYRDHFKDSRHDSCIHGGRRFRAVVRLRIYEGGDGHGWEGRDGYG